MEMMKVSLGIMCASSYILSAAISYNCYDTVPYDYDAGNRKLYSKTYAFFLPTAYCIQCTVSTVVSTVNLRTKVD